MNRKICIEYELLNASIVYLRKSINKNIIFQNCMIYDVFKTLNNTKHIQYNSIEKLNLILCFAQLGKLQKTSET